jgi:hypothetical protein
MHFSSNKLHSAEPGRDRTTKDIPLRTLAKKDTFDIPFIHFGSHIPDFLIIGHLSLIWDIPSQNF